MELPDYFGANADLKVTALAAGMVIGADCIDDLGLLRQADANGLVLLRADSAYYNHVVVSAAARASAKVSITARIDPHVKKAIAAIPEDA